MIRTAPRAALLAMLALSPLAAHAGPPFVTDDPAPTEYGHFEIYLFTEGTFDAQPKEGTALGLEVNYGALPDLQLSASLPANFDAPDRRHATWGISEAELGVKYRFMHEDGEGLRPQISFYPSVEFAIGRSGPGIDDGGMRISLPLWAQKDMGVWSVFGGGGYRISTGATARNSVFMGAGFLRQFGANFRIGAELFHETPKEERARGETGFNIGAVCDLNEMLHLAGSIGSKFSDPKRFEGVSYYAALEWTI